MGFSNESTHRTWLRKLVIGLILTLWASAGQLGITNAAHAQGPTVTWSQPENLSNTPTSSTHTVVLTDGYGNVHVFWSEEVGGKALASDEMVRGGNTIYYRKWNGTAWTQPIDILFVPGDALADYVAAAMDQQNRIHLVWTGMSRLYYSSAPSERADSAAAWSTPVPLPGLSARSGFESSIVVTPDSVIHVAYAGYLADGEAIGIYHTSSTDGGLSWASPQQISDALSPNEGGYTSPKMIADRTGRLHVTWASFNDAGFGESVYYARSIDSGQSWEPSRVMMASTMEENSFMGFPALMEDAEGRIYLIHVGEQTNGRMHHVSVDGGLTWSQPRVIIQEMEGVNGIVVPVVDGAGKMHLVINMRPTATQVTGIYYAPQARDDFAPIVPVAIDETSASYAHHTSVAVRLGNEIHVVWSQDRGGEIWHVRGQIANLAAQPALTPSLDASEPITTTKPRAADPTTTPSLPSRVGRPTSFDQPAAIEPVGQSQGVTLLLGLTPVALLIAGVILWKRQRIQ